MPEQTRKDFTGHVIDKAAIPEELKAAGDDADLWAYASVEVADREKDVIRIDGISLKNHRAESPIKVISQHLRRVEDGTFPVIGKVTRFERTTYKADDASVPALAFGMKFAPTRLGQEAKALYDGGFLTDFSVGLRSLSAKPITGGGSDFQKSELFEISGCLMGMNQNAHVMQRLKAALDETDERPEKRAALDGAFLDNLVTKLTTHLDKQYLQAIVAIRNVESQFVKDGFTANRFENIDAAFARLASRFDDLESLIVSQSKEARTTAEDHNPEHDSDIDWTPLESAVKQIITSLHPRK